MNNKSKYLSDHSKSVYQIMVDTYLQRLNEANPHANSPPRSGGNAPSGSGNSRGTLIFTGFEFDGLMIRKL